jgi:hypothetical protein
MENRILGASASRGEVQRTSAMILNVAVANRKERKRQPVLAKTLQGRAQAVAPPNDPVKQALLAYDKEPKGSEERFQAFRRVLKVLHDKHVK